MLYISFQQSSADPCIIIYSHKKNELSVVTVCVYDLIIITKCTVLTNMITNNGEILQPDLLSINYSTICQDYIIYPTPN